MEVYSGYRNKSASHTQHISAQKEWRLNMVNECTGRREGKIFDPERGSSQSKKVSINVLAAPQTLNNQLKTEIPQRTLSKNKSAIQDLQQLVTPRSQIKNVQNQLKRTSQLFQHQERRFDSVKAGTQKDGVRVKTQQKFKKPHTRDISQQELQRLSILLGREERKNSDLMSSVAKIDEQKKELELYLRQQREKSKDLKRKYSQLQELFKKQMIINLQLEAVLGQLTVNQREQNEKRVVGADLNGKSEEELRAIIECFRRQKESKEVSVVRKYREMQRQFDNLRGKCQKQIDTLVTELKQKCLQLNNLKSNSQCDVQTQDKVANSTIPSYNGIDISLNENQMKGNRIGHNVFNKMSVILSKEGQGEKVMREQEMQQIMKLNSELFQKQKMGVRPYCKTDRL